MIAAIIAGASLSFAVSAVVWARRQAKKYPDRPAFLAPCKVCAAIEELSAAQSDDPLPDAVIETLREAYAIPRLVPVARESIDRAPKVMPTCDDRFLIWSRGFTQHVGNDPKEAQRFWRTVKPLTGHHQFWDREYSIERPRSEHTNPMAVGDV